MFDIPVGKHAFYTLAAVIIICTVTCPLFADKIILKDGEVIVGKIVRSDSKSITIKHPHTGYREISREKIDKIIQDAPKQPPKKTDTPKTEKAVDPVTGFPRPGSEADEKFRKLIARLQGENPISPEGLLTKLLELGSDAVPSILQYLSTNPKERTLDPFFDALVMLKEDNTALYLGTLLGSKSRKIRLGAIGALRKVAGKDAVKALLAAASGIDPDTSIAARKTISAILRTYPDDQELFEFLRQKAIGGDSRKKVMIVSILGESASKLANRIVIDFLRESEALIVRSAALASLGTLGFNDPDVCMAIRRLLKDKEPHLRREAALSLGRIQDFESVNDLIELLADKNSGVRGNAYWALKSISGLRFPPNQKRWKSWWSKESLKARERREALLASLHNSTRDEMIKTIRDLVRIRLGKKGIVEGLLRYVSYGEPEVRKEICSALGFMKARQAVPHLIQRLNDSNQSVIGAAHQALVAITGRKDLPPRKEAWENQ